MVPGYKRLRSEDLINHFVVCRHVIFDYYSCTACYRFFRFGFASRPFSDLCLAVLLLFCVRS